MPVPDAVGLEGVPRDLPEIDMGLHQAAQPCVFELLLTPQRGNAVGIVANFQGHHLIFNLVDLCVAV